LDTLATVTFKVKTLSCENPGDRLRPHPASQLTHHCAQNERRREAMKTLLFLIPLLLTGCVILPHPRYVASKIEGRILSNGHPVSNVKVTRKITVVSSGKETIQAAITDAQGRFVWERVTDFAMVASISTWAYTYKYYADYDGVQILIWEGAKVDAGDLGERESRDLEGKWIPGKDFFEVHDDSLRFTYDLARGRQAP
jgi:hypothetical protein